MSKSFVSRILFSSLVALFVSIDAHALHYCAATYGDKTMCRGTTTTTKNSSAIYTSYTGASGIVGCLTSTEYNVIYDATGKAVTNAYWATCNSCDADNGFTRVSASIPMMQKVTSGTGMLAIMLPGTPYQNEDSYSGYVCCGVKRNSSSTQILSPSGYYGYVGSRTTYTYGYAWTYNNACSSYNNSYVLPPTQYSCSCVTGFTSSTNGTTNTSCNCVMANGYVCHATECGAGRYISDDGQTCELCPTGNSQGITSGTSANVSIPGQTLGVASSIDGCYLNANTEYKDANGNKFNYNAACYYNE